MHSLLRGPGYAVLEDEVIIPALEFWNAFVELLVDAEFEEPEESKPWLEAAKNHIMQVFQELLVKVRFPPHDIFARIEKETQKEFRQFRADVKELLASSHSTVNHALTEAIVQACIRSFESQAWLHLEAALFCLSAVAEADQTSEDPVLAVLFGSSMYAALSTTAQVPARTRRTAVDILGQFSEFFERHTQYLPAALDFLFSSLQSPVLAQQAASSIASLCSSCRASLTSQLRDFLAGYDHLRTLPTADAATKEKVIGGIAAVIQAVSAKSDQITGLELLLAYIQSDIDDATQSFMEGAFEEGQVAAWTAMRCLASIGKASQAPDDVSIDLDSADGPQSDFWRSGPGMPTQTRICNLIRSVLELLHSFQGQSLELHGDILESICAIFKSGFAEAAPGPFVLPPNVTVEFISTIHLSTPRMEVVLNMTCSFLRSYTISSSPQINTDVMKLLQHLITIIRSLDDPSSEAEISCGLIEVLTRFMPRYVGAMTSLDVPDLEVLFNFPMICLGIPEHLPQRAAAQFWVSHDFLSSVRHCKMSFDFQLSLLEPKNSDEARESSS
jgi:hypothetical protein